MTDDKADLNYINWQTKNGVPLEAALKNLGYVRVETKGSDCDKQEGYTLAVSKCNWEDYIDHALPKENILDKPKCPCEEGINSKACAGCPQDEERKQTFRPFKDCDELVEFWSKNYQTGFRPAYTKPLVNIKKKNCQEIYFITGFDFDTECSRVFVNNEWLTLDELFNNFEFLDRNIIGVLSEE